MSCLCSDIPTGQELYNIYKCSQSLRQVNNNMYEILAKIMISAGDEADAYYQFREELNVDLIKKTDQLMSDLAIICASNSISAQILPTSSVYAGTNLINDSDSDISILVANCVLTYNKIHNMLENVGFKFVRYVGSNPLNMYYLFSKQIDNDKFTIKLRSIAESKLIICLHNYLDTKLSKIEKIAITYGKYHYKKLSDQSTDNIDKLSYAIFTKMVYEMYFYYVDGGFMLELY